MIRIADPAKLGPALAQIRNLLGLSRHDLGRAVEANTGRPMLSVVKQIQQWDNGRHAPTVSSLGPVLDALGYDLALIPREDARCDHPHGTGTICGVCGHDVAEMAPGTDLSATETAQTGPARGSGCTEAATAVSAAVAITAKRADEAEDVRRRITEHAEHRPSSLGGDGYGYGPCVGCGQLWPCTTARDERTTP